MRRVFTWLLPVAVAIGVVAAVASCGGTGDKPTATIATVFAADTNAKAAPLVTGPAAGRAADGAATASSTLGNTENVSNVSSQVIDTPAAVIADAIPGYTRTPGDFSIVAEATVPKIDVFDAWDSAVPFTVLANPLPSGSKLTFLVDGQTADRAHVLVPIHPADGSVSNEVTGWIPLSQVVTKRNAYRIVISLEAKQLTVFKGAGTLMSVPVGVGTAATPTPGGRYYIKELIKPINPRTKKYDPNGVYGPYAYGLSGYSRIYDADNPFNGGDGQLGIHGTNEPQLIGTNVSNGCIRVTNENISKMRALLPLGTPVVVEA